MVSAADALELLDWKRQVFALYEQVRTSADARSAWALWRQGRDTLFREHPQSPLPAGRRAGFAGCDYFEYDSQARVLARVEPGEPSSFDVVGSTGTAFPFTRVGTAQFELAGSPCTLALLWNEGYGGGLFVSFQDETSGRESYPAARYLLDTVKGADLGTAGAELVLDFNFAYNPSCAYDSSWACPLAPPESRLSVAVRAGERAP
ncbi:MAG TPA: DUF1684 domain-containing protein [Gaiellaceae bacterium]|jgi:hypothetical protein